MVSTEVGVLGGGIMGICTAYFLSQFGHSVTVFERKGVGEEASGRNAGSLSLQNKPFPIIPLALGGMATWEMLDRDLDGIGLKRSGGLRLAETQVEVDKLQTDLEVQNQHGLDIDHLTPAKVQHIAPYLSLALMGANYSPRDAYVDALTAMGVIARAAGKRGTCLLTQTQVNRLDTAEDGEICIWTSDQRGFRCRRLVITAGIWTKQILEQLGLELPLRLRINQMTVTSRLPHFIKHMITHAQGHLTVKQLEVGSVLIGGGWPGKGSLEEDAKLLSHESVLGNLAVAVRVIPRLAGVVAVRMWSGFDGRTEDQLPVLGAIPGRENVLVATSCFGGYVAGPFIGKLIAQIIHYGQPEMDIGPFGISRYLAKEQ